MSRYVENTFKEDELSKKVTDEWLLREISTLAHFINSRIQKQPETVDSTHPYTGSCGIAFAFIRAAPHIGQEWLEKGRETLSAAFQEKSSHHHRNLRYLTGHIGTLTTMASDTHFDIRRIEQEIKEAAEDFSKGGEEMENEILNGRAGLLASILWLRNTVDKHLFEDSHCKRVIEHICQYLLYSGARNSDKSEELSPPLSYHWHNTMYIGAAHGLSGIVLVLLSLINEFEESSQTTKKYQDGLKNRIRSTVDWFVSIQTPDGGFASSLDYVARPKSYDLVHWCHGAPGVIPTLLKAYQVFGDESYLKAAEQGGEQIWSKGILKKGPGLCHGVAGNGYILLFLWKVTGKDKWLNRAKSFAYLMMSPEIQKQQRNPDSPFSLFEGWAGSLCFLTNLISSNIETPCFPLYPYFP